MERIDTNQEQEVLVDIAKARVKKRKEFYIQFIFFMLLVVVYVLKTYYGVSFDFFPLQYINGFVMAIATLYIVIDGIYFISTEFILGKSWEEQQIKKMIEKKSEKQIWK
nr:2TM domain-containing protein [uncultured Flavobacterium sp.]